MENPVSQTGRQLIKQRSALGVSARLLIGSGGLIEELILYLMTFLFKECLCGVLFTGIRMQKSACLGERRRRREMDRIAFQLDFGRRK